MIKDRTIIINDSKNLSKLVNKNKNNLKTEFLYSLYKGDVYNPPFFKKIIYLKSDITIDVLQLLWNMLIINGTLNIYIKNKNAFLKALPTLNNVVSEIKDDMLIVHKRINTIYTFKKYRTLDFIIAGVMKSGSTSALHNLSMHPDIFMPKDEIHYFEDLNTYGNGKEWLMKQLDFNYKLVGLKTSDAIFFPIAHELMQNFNPYMKIIIFLRDPCERAYSHYKMMVNEPFCSKETFENYINDEIKNRLDEPYRYNIGLWNNYIKRGFYYEQIQHLLKYFPIQNVLILIAENVKVDMENQYNRVYDFLNIPRLKPNKPYELKFISKDSTLLKDKSPKMYAKLKKIFSNDVQQLEQFLGYKTGWW